MSTNVPVENRLRIKREHKAKVSQLIETLNINVLRVVERSDGDFMFELGFLPDEQRLELLGAIPETYFALRAVVRR